MSSRLNNYLRSHRRRAGFSQSEVAFLLGTDEGGRISRYEKGHCIPTLRTALALATIFGASLSNLFPGIQVKIDGEVSPRIKHLRAGLEKRREEHRETAADANKLNWLDERNSSLTKYSDPAT
jgi:transcriptional regulator with XRE-family HTH domain